MNPAVLSAAVALGVVWAVLALAVRRHWEAVLAGALTVGVVIAFELVGDPLRLWGWSTHVACVMAYAFRAFSLVWALRVQQTERLQACIEARRELEITAHLSSES